MKLRRLTAIVATAMVVTAVLPAAAMAQEAEAPAQPEHQPTIDEVKERAQAAIDRRLATLGSLTDRVEGSEHMTDAHRSSLLADYQSATAGLTGLGVQIAAASTYAELRSLVPLIASDYRVYLVIAPKSGEVAASDRVSKVADRMTDAADVIDEAIARAEAAGYDVSEAKRWMVSARDEIAEARRTGGPVADLVIDLDAGDWEEPAKSTLQDGKRRLENARVDLRQAHASLESARKALRDALS